MRRRLAPRCVWRAMATPLDPSNQPMCGIAGVVGVRVDPELARQMAAAMVHRGPDTGGSWDQPGVALAHRRLKVIDLSDAGAQPMSTIDGRLTITFNGEIYNFRELREELGAHTFRSGTDTEVVLRAYERWGVKALERFDGMFAFAIWDANERSLMCARDRLGIKPLYYAQVHSQFLFASEIRPLLRAGVPARPNPRVIHSYLAHDCYDHSEETFFVGVKALPPGHFAFVSDGCIATPRSYWRLEDDVMAVRMAADQRDRRHELLGLILDTTRTHMRADVPIAIALSGGLDSATLATAIDRVHPTAQAVESFSFVFDDARYSERPYIEAIASHSARKAHFITVKPDSFVSAAEQLVRAQEQPHAGLPVFCYAEVHAALRARGFVVAMDGSGLDELLAGYAHFLPAFWRDLVEAGRSDALEREWSVLAIDSPDVRRNARSLMDRASQHDGLALDMTRGVRPACITKELAAPFSGERPTFARPFGDHLRNAMYRDLRYTKLPRSLRFADRLSMTASTELRPPFLDRRLVAYCFALPAEDRIHLGISKAILREATASLMPDSVRLAPKRPVQTPQREWFRGPLRSFIQEIVDTPSFWQRGWIDRRRGQTAMAAFMDGDGDNSFFLWQWANLELWSQQFLDRSGT